jgi:hypothetical protein
VKVTKLRYNIYIVINVNTKAESIEYISWIKKKVKIYLSLKVKTLATKIPCTNTEDMYTNNFLYCILEREVSLLIYYWYSIPCLREMRTFLNRLWML